MRRFFLLLATLSISMVATAQFSATDHVRAVKYTLFKPGSLWTYEQVLPSSLHAPCHGSVEASFGWFGQGGNSSTDIGIYAKSTANEYDTPTNLRGVQLKVGYKFNFATGREGKRRVSEGKLGSGFYLMPEFTYVTRARRYDAFVGNDGWDIFVESKTYRDNAVAGMLIGGYQLVGKHLLVDFFFGFGRYTSANIFDQRYFYGFGTSGSEHRCHRVGMRVGLML